MNAGDLGFACASVLVERLIAGGLAGVCVSPGSRSTPLALAFARAPAAVPLFVHLDERSSAAFALGLASATGRPVAVVCTSGTAAANLYPSVVEAAQSCVPLLLLTADRPPALRGSGANQTIDQFELFGRYPRAFIETPLPAQGSGRMWASLADRAIASSTGIPPGPVHVNVPFDEPLVPGGAPVDLGPLGDAASPSSSGASPTDLAAAPVAAESDVAQVRDLLEQVERGVIVAGQLRGDCSAWIGVAARAGWPLLAEPLSGLRGAGALAAGQHLIRDVSAESVLQIGRAPTTRTTQGFVARAHTTVVVETPGIPADPLRAAAATIRCDPAALGRALGGMAGREPGEWFATWSAADRRARVALDAALDGDAEPFEPRVARDVARAVLNGGVLFVGNSTPVRDLDATMEPRGGITVHANRGASGIDGTVSTALGVAAAGAPVVALLGDLAMLHDASGLLWAARSGSGCVFVVPNNRGGGIFDLLPAAELPEHERLFVTPHDVSLRAVALAAGVHYVLADRAEELGPAVTAGLAHGGCWIVEVPIDRASTLARRRALADVMRGFAL